MNIIIFQVIASVISLSAIAWFLIRNQRALAGPKRNHELGAFSRAVKRSLAVLDGHPDEVVLVVGVLRGKSVPAPLSKRECIAWQVRIFARWPRGGEAEICSRSEIVDGTLTDESGEVHFDGAGARAVLAANSFRADELSKNFRQIAESVYPAEISQTLVYHAIETILVNGDRAAMTARVPSRAGDGYRDGQALRLVSRSDAELVVTDDVEMMRS